jgi:hypothetical protein
MEDDGEQFGGTDDGSRDDGDPERPVRTRGAGESSRRHEREIFCKPVETSVNPEAERLAAPDDTSLRQHRV